MERRYATRRPSHNDRPLSQSQATAQMPQDGWDIEDHVVRPGGLPFLAVDNGLHQKLMWIRDDSGGDKCRSDGSELVEPLAAPVLAT